jgi:hypothetical protein
MNMTAGPGMMSNTNEAAMNAGSVEAVGMGKR